MTYKDYQIQEMIKQFRDYSTGELSNLLASYKSNANKTEFIACNNKDKETKDFYKWLTQDYKRAIEAIETVLSRRLNKKDA